MSRSLRYSNPDVCDQLAAQYVAGDMTARVRRRMEQLMREHPPLKAAVADWSDRMMPLQNRYPEQAPPASLWRQIDPVGAIKEAAAQQALMQGRELIGQPFLLQLVDRVLVVGIEQIIRMLKDVNIQRALVEHDGLIGRRQAHQQGERQQQRDGSAGAVDQSNSFH